MKSMANTKVTIKVVAQAKELYIVGSSKNLGEWDSEKAVKLEYCEKCNAFYTNKMFPIGSTVEFKVLADKTWARVEKGIWCEEIENHSFVAEKGLEVFVEVHNFQE